MSNKNQLIIQIEKLRLSTVENLVNERLGEFSAFKQKDNDQWFSELCFCLLTANSKAATAMQIQNEVGSKGFIEYSFEAMKNAIIKNKHRFHNNKAGYIVMAREHLNIKNKIEEIVEKKDTFHARLWLAENIKGLGFKESSHFLRNVGYTDRAILDRHILGLMEEYSLIKQKPKTITKKSYYEMEEILAKFCKTVDMTQAELDLYLWFMKNNNILK